MTFFMQTPDHDFAPESRYTSDELAKKRDEIFNEDPKVAEAIDLWLSDAVSSLDLLQRLETLKNRALSRAMDALSEGEDS